MQIKVKYGYRVFLKYMDGSVRPQQKAGFENEQKASRTRDKAIGELYTIPAEDFFSGNNLVHYYINLLIGQNDSRGIS